MSARASGKLAEFAPFTVEHFRWWAYELELDNGDRWEVEPYFQRYLEDVFKAFRARGLWRLWLMVPEGNGKTTNLAGLSLYHCEFYPAVFPGQRAFVPWAASVRDQAELGFQQARVFGESIPKDRRPKFQEGYRRIKFANGGRIQIFAAGAEHADGIIPTLPIIDELHAHHDLRLYRRWVGKLRKRQAQMLVISTAGEPGSEFELTRQKIVGDATDMLEEGGFHRYATERVVMHEYAVRDDRIREVEMVKQANPASWIDERYLQEKYEDPDMTERHWRRFTCNLATMDSGKEPFIDGQDWDELTDEQAVIRAGATVCLGGDGSRTWDTTVIAWAEADPDGTVTVDARVFSVRDDIDCHVKHEGGKIDFDDVEAFIVDRFDEFNVEAAGYDPRYLERSMDIVSVRLPEAAVRPVEPSSKAMRDALQTMFNLAAEGKLRHRGDPVVRQHVLNASVERGFGSELRRVRKVDSRLPIDAVPAMALAIALAANSERSVYEDEGMMVV